MPTLFEKLIARQLPCHVVYEDDHVFAFLDLQPRAAGHLLLVPKEAAATLDALSDASAAALGRALPRLCRALLHVTGCGAYNVLQNNGARAGQLVPHVHFHLVPKPDAQRGLILGGHDEPLDQAAAPALAAALARAAQPAGAGDKEAGGGPTGG